MTHPAVAEGVGATYVPVEEALGTPADGPKLQERNCGE